jgi:penicillin amidase
MRTLLALSSLFLLSQPLAAATSCGFDKDALTFAGTPLEQAKCLLRHVRQGGALDPPLAVLPPPLEELIDQPVMISAAALRKWLAERGISEAEIGGPVTDRLSRARNDESVAPSARYFVIHDTSIPSLCEAPSFPAEMDQPSWRWNGLQEYANFPEAHLFITRDGKSVGPQGRTFATPWRATKLERPREDERPKGLFLHIENVLPRRCEPDPNAPPEWQCRRWDPMEAWWVCRNDRIGPNPGFSEAEMDRLALVYVAASVRRGTWLIPAFHAAVDAGIPEGHDDPQNFDLVLWAQRVGRLVQALTPAQTSETLRLRGLQKPVTVLRDAWGVPHIYAETQDDLFFAQGFVAAQDRLFQMELWRRVGEGRLAEVLGKKEVERDRFARLLRYRGDLKTEYESYAPDARQIIEAFVRGINANIESRRGHWPIEFKLAGFAPEPWTPEVCLTRMAGWGLTSNALLETLRAKLVRETGAGLVDEIVETDPPQKIEIPPGLDLAGIDPSVLGAAAAANAPITFQPTQGSNNWVVDGSLSATGKPLLANDPHRALQLPSLRWMVHLVGPGWNVIGAGEPSLPGVSIGHNDRVAFGLTVVGMDQQDLYVEETNPAHPNQYRYQGRWVPMRIERERIRIQGEKPQIVELKFTVHGPVLSEDRERHRAYALRWVGSEPGTAGYLAALSLDRARSWPEFLRALERWKVPSENFVYADVDGNIGWQAAGLAPVRKGWHGLLPVPGDGRFEWQGFLKLDDLPRTFNPAAHFIATANHNILPEGYTQELGYEWGSPTRFERIVEVLSTPDRKFTVDGFDGLQHDVVSLPARRLVRLLAAARGASDELRPWIERLTRWDAAIGRDSSPAALYELWLGKLPAAVFKPKLPEASWQVLSNFISTDKLLNVLETASPRWLGGTEARDAALFQALREAVEEARTKLGPNPDTWRWGALHTTPFHHPLAVDDERKKLFDLPTVERGGDGDTINVGAGPGFAAVHGASFREVLDVADWDRSVAINVPGQSGEPGSPHYSDLLPLWAGERSFPFLFSHERIEQASPERLLLAPATRRPAGSGPPAAERRR